jgi:hypothetical protein
VLCCRVEFSCILSINNSLPQQNNGINPFTTSRNNSTNTNPFKTNNTISIFFNYFLFFSLSVSISPSKTINWVQFFFFSGFGFGGGRDALEEEEADEAGYTGCYGVWRRAGDAQGGGGSGTGERRVWLFCLL